MKPKDLAALSIPNKLAQCAGITVKAATKQSSKSEAKDTLRRVAGNPHSFLEDETWGELALRIIEERALTPDYIERDEPAPYKRWGTDLEEGAVDQMENSCRLPISVRGALMPDAHQGYGLPIGGVLATDNAIIPFAVGVDIACRMKMSVYPISPIILNQEPKKFERALEDETRFGKNCQFRDTKREHDVMDLDWKVSKVTRKNKDRAWSQLGTSGSGNHFVEFGVFTVTEKSELGLEPGEYLTLLSHSGSRGVGAAVANHYSKLARKRNPQLPDNLQHLAYFSLDSHEGKEYWNAMQLMGKYAEANHACIHTAIAKRLGYDVILDIENHHNFAWKEIHDGKEVIVHRKGATPADKGVLGIIPGSMGAPGYVVRGLGDPDSLNSASHGAGRKMSRTQAKKTFTWSETKKLLAERGVKVMSAGLDECPMAYKDIDKVMAAQVDLVVPLGRFDPKLVRMAEDEKGQ